MPISASGRIARICGRGRNAILHLYTVSIGAAVWSIKAEAVS